MRNVKDASAVSTTEDRELHEAHDAKVVEDWIHRMSAEELVGQMSQIDINMLLEDDDNGGKRLNLDNVNHFIGDLGIGSVLNTVPVPWKAQDYRNAAMQIQNVAKAHKRPVSE